MHAYLLQRSGKSYAVVREERGVRTTVEDGLEWDEALARRLFHERRDPPPKEDELPKEPPRCAAQPGRRKFARDPAVMRAARSRVYWRRPYCLACAQFMPAPDEPREYWLEAHGHRKPSGEPCPGGSRVVVLAANDPIVLRALQASQGAGAANDNARAKPKRVKPRRRKRRKGGRRKRQRWVQLLLVDTPVVPRVPRVPRVRLVVDRPVVQLSIEEWLRAIEPAQLVRTG